MELASDFTVEDKPTTPATRKATADAIERFVGEVIAGKKKPKDMDVGMLTGAVQGLRDAAAEINHLIANPLTTTDEIVVIARMAEGALLTSDRNDSRNLIESVCDDLCAILKRRTDADPAQAAPAGFEPWLRTVCITAPPPQAHDLAKQAWDEGFKRGTAASAQADEAAGLKLIGTIDEPDREFLLRVYAKNGCQHNWVDARNAHVLSGEVCTKCRLMRSGNQPAPESTDGTPE